MSCNLLTLKWIRTYQWLTILMLVAQAICLKDLNIKVPEAVAVGNTVTLSCFYDLENAALYSIRWYFDQAEFYRYVPKETPAIRIFPIQSGISVDVRKSNEHNVVIQRVGQRQSGNYQCEVSADAPLFHTESSTATMLVAKVPESDPVIRIYAMPEIDSVNSFDDNAHNAQGNSNKKHFASVGETFKANCVSGPSYPPVNFTWIVNGVKYPSTHYGLRSVENFHQQDMLPSSTIVTADIKEAWSELVIYVDDNHINVYNRKLIVRCETNIYQLYKASAETELTVIEDNFWTGFGGGKMSPTTHKRGNRGDPDNSALTGTSLSSTFRNGNDCWYNAVNLCLRLLASTILL